MTFTFIDLCCGIGGFHKGLRKGKCVLACDINKECREIYAKNYKISPLSNIFDIKNKNIPDHNILCAGFPCQPFSSAGKQNGMDDIRFNVYYKILSIIKKKKPNIIMLENVKNIITINEGKVIRKIIKDLNDLHYNISYSTLNTSSFGLAQNRERVFIIGIYKKYKNKTFNFQQLKSINNKKILKDICDLSNKNYIERNKYVLLQDEKIKIQPSGLIFCGYIKGNIRIAGVKPNTEHLSRVHKQPNRIYHINGVHPTLSSSESSGRYYIYDGIGVRKLSVQECYKIMGFKKFICHEKSTICYKQAGNAVSPKIIKYIRKELIKQDII